MSDAERAQKLRELLEEARSLDVTIYSDDEARAYLDWRAKTQRATGKLPCRHSWR